MARKYGVAVVAVMGLFSSAVYAHPGHGPHSVVEGPLHFLAGLEHVTAAVAVGVLGFAVVRPWARKRVRRERAGRE